MVVGLHPLDTVAGVEERRSGAEPPGRGIAFPDEPLDRGIGVSATDGVGQLGDGRVLGEPVHLRELDEVVGQGRALDPGGGDDVGQHGARLDADQLIGIADQHEPGIGTDGRQQRGHQRQVDHGDLVDDDDVVLERVLGAGTETDTRDGPQQSVDGARRRPA